MSYQLHDYQETAKNFILNHPKCGLFLDMGLGKSLITLSALDQLNPNHHVLVIAPINIARSVWIDEIHKWDFKLRYKSLIVNDRDVKLTKKARHQRYMEALTEPPTIYFLNRELVPDLVDFYVNHRKDSKRKAQFVYPEGWIFKTVIIDELQSFKSHSAERFHALKCIQPCIERFIGLTGTPTPNGLMDLWSQIYLMDQGQRLGHTITAYRKQYFMEGMIVNGYPVSWNPLPGAEEQIYESIRDLVMSAENTNLNLPDCIFRDIMVHMDASEQKLYKEFMQSYVLEFGQEQEVTAANAAVLSSKLSQIASGAIYLDNENETAKTKEYKIIHEKKLEMLKYLIDNTNKSVLVAYHFKSDKDMILNYFKKIKHPDPVIVFDGSADMIKRWNEGTIPILLVQPASAGHGLNLQYGGHTLIWYTLSWSLEEYQQTNKRLHRQGQTEPVTIYHLLTEKTIDDKILNALKQKDLTQQTLLDAVQITIQDFH